MQLLQRLNFIAALDEKTMEISMERVNFFRLTQILNYLSHFMKFEGH